MPFDDRFPSLLSMKLKFLTMISFVVQGGLGYVGVHEVAKGAKQKTSKELQIVAYKRWECNYLILGILKRFNYTRNHV